MIKLHTALHNNVVSATPTSFADQILFLLHLGHSHFHIYPLCVSPVLRTNIKNVEKPEKFFLQLQHCLLPYAEFSLPL